MTLSHITREEAMTRLTQNGSVDPNSIDVLCDFLRAEVHARKHAPRAATLSRVLRLLSPAISIDEQRMEDACEALEREGDIMPNPGGILYATPTRVVVTTKNARVFSSMPTRSLARALGHELKANGASRTICLVDGLADAVSRVNGVMILPEIWAGLDRSPSADAAFLEKLDQRLEWQASGAGSLERDGDLDWRTWQVTPQGAQWRSNAQGRLWWARTRFGGHFRAWTAGATPATSAFVALNAEDADRARFALSRNVRSASVLRVQRMGTRVTLEVPGWLPRPEYRWLSLNASPVMDSKGLRWEVPSDREDEVAKPLVERLGLTIEAV